MHIGSPPSTRNELTTQAERNGKNGVGPFQTAPPPLDQMLEDLFRVAEDRVTFRHLQHTNLRLMENRDQRDSACVQGLRHALAG